MARQEFKLPYIGVDKSGPYHLLIGSRGECSVVIQIANPVIRYSGSVAAYEEFHRLFLGLVKVLGDGYILQKLDIIFKKKYHAQKAPTYLQQKYNDHFEGRDQLIVDTYLVLTLPHFKPGMTAGFRQIIGKVLDLLSGAEVLKETVINQLIKRLLAMDFRSESIALDNYLPSDTEISLGKRAVRSINLVDTDSVDLPQDIGNYIELNDKEAIKGFPVDFFSFLFKVPEAEIIVLNQVIEIPNQFMILKKLELKKKRHSGIPDPANTLCVEDIDLLLNDVARENQLLVNSHFSIVFAAEKEQLQKATNYIESSLFQLGIIPSKNAYNQLELFRCALPGNAVELKSYDWFLTTCDAAICFFFKERMPKDDASDFLIRFTDRRGIPVAIDPSDLPKRTGKINNLNKFVLGGSGSGKSFCMNALLEQYMLYNMDVVIVDTGHSYSGLCSYLQGKYITYTDQQPITMNPFRIAEDEYNIEKKDFLVTLIAVAWKGPEGSFSPVERDVISNVLSAYFTRSFAQNSELSFNSFYAFALEKIPEIKREEKIVFDFDEFRYVLKKFYKDGEFADTLNKDADKSLFSERFIVFEIDSIKENKILFPLVTLIIMDVFIQKMRYRANRRKALVIEEAWKAIASPLMAGYILYLYKTVRKFWGEVIVVTQELSDIIGNPVVKDSIINNSDTMVLLDQTKFKDRFDEIAATLSISDHKRRQIFSINQLDNRENRGPFKEVYFLDQVYGLEMSLEQYLTFTTEKPEKTAVEAYLHKYGSYEEALDAFIRDLKTSKLTLSAFISAVNQNQFK